MLGTPKLTDPQIMPADEVLYAIIGENRKYWDQFNTTLKELYPDVVMEWKYYKDAKRWLLPVARNKKNLFWVSIMDDTFLVSFWFGHKLTPVFEASNVPEKIKADFRKAEQNKMGRGLAIKVYSDTDLEEVYELLKFKYQLK
jgi:hypothetical protein